MWHDVCQETKCSCSIDAGVNSQHFAVDSGVSCSIDAEFDSQHLLLTVKPVTMLSQLAAVCNQSSTQRQKMLEHVISMTPQTDQ